MILRRVRVLVPADLVRLPQCSSGCLTDQLNAEAPWARAALERWGMAGLAIDAGGATAGYLLVCTGRDLPAGHPLSGHAVRPETAVLMALHVVDADRHTGVARHLVQSTSARLLGRADSIEAVGCRVGSSCLSPSARWLHQVGFELVEGMDWLPAGAQRLRLDLDRTVRWPDLTKLAERLPRAIPNWGTPATDRSGVNAAHPARRAG